MKEILKITLNLVIIFVVAGAIIAVVFANTAPIIAQILEKQKQEALKELMPQAAMINAVGGWEPIPGKRGEYFVGKDTEGEPLGYIATSYGKGYSGYINVMVAVNREMAVKDIKILSHTETPGLGDEIERKYFTQRFQGKSVDQLEVVKMEDPNRIEAISGATISSRAVTKGVREGVQFLKEKYQGGAAGE